MGRITIAAVEFDNKITGVFVIIILIVLLIAFFKSLFISKTYIERSTEAMVVK